MKTLTVVKVIWIVNMLVWGVAVAQISTGSGKPGALLVISKKATDTMPPTIRILEPPEIAQRGLKIISGNDIVVKSGELKIRGLANDSSGVAIVKVNGKEALLKPGSQGYEFYAEVLLEFGNNVVEIVASDIHGNRDRLSIRIKREVAVLRDEKTLAGIELFKGHQVWAAVIGISDYQSPEISDLRYADRDAEDFYQFLITDLDKGGRGVPKTNIKKLLNKEATKTNIEGAILDFMKNALEEDVAIIYFAGHGAPDPVRKTVPYLLAYDSDLTRPGATAVMMSRIQDAIRDFVKAKHIIVFADACHSAGVSNDITTRGEATSDLINKFLTEIAQTSSSVLTLSASERNEYSQESQKWGGGHGVFTYALLEGLSGKADADQDSIVRLGELVDYIDITVRRETRSNQHPSRSNTQWDRNLPFSIVVEKE